MALSKRNKTKGEGGIKGTKTKQPNLKAASTNQNWIITGVIVVISILTVALFSMSDSDSTTTSYKHFADAPLADPREAQTEIIRPLPSDRLQQWNPVAINFTRRVVLDDTGKVFTMRTMAMNPPIFEIDDFLTPKETSRLQKLANRTGFLKSDSTWLDGSNYDDKDKDTKGLSLEEANELFRHSDQTWLQHDQDPYMQTAIQRVMNLGLLPQHVRRNSEPMQVVKYDHHGHYESHHDSEKDGLGPCCIDPFAKKHNMATGVFAVKRPLKDRCRLCRFMTVLYYLADTEEGGETIFPLADTTDEELKAWMASNDPLKYKQTRKCEPGIKVKPKKGKAVVWYNHKIDRGYLGELDQRSLHGACNVIKGHKWISNHWMSAIPHPDVPREFAKSMY